MKADSITMSSPSRSRFDPRAITLVAGMAVGSVVMWIVIPAAWVVGASQVGHTQPTLLPLLMIFIGAPLTMIPTAKVLGVLDHRHQELMGTLDERRRAEPWRQSMRDADDGGPQSVLAVVMVASVAVAFVALAIWFFFFAGSSLPS